jgi:hypothetical protein
MVKNLMMWWQACEKYGQREEKYPYNLLIIKRKKETLEIFSKTQS